MNINKLKLQELEKGRKFINILVQRLSKRRLKKMELSRVHYKLTVVETGGVL